MATPAPLANNHSWGAWIFCSDYRPHSLFMMRKPQRDLNLFATLGGRIRCAQCQARAKSSKQQCRKPAMVGKRVCRTHGGASTGPRTEAGRRRCAQASRVHGRETTEMRAERRVKIAELQKLETIGRALGIIAGSKTRGPKVNL